MLRLGCPKVDIVATVEGEGIKRETQTFSSTMPSLTELKEWLLSLGVTHVTMESTGVYCKLVCILELGGFTLLVVNARHQVCSKSQDGQEGFSLDMQVASCRTSER